MQTIFPKATGSSGQYITAYRNGVGPTSAELLGVAIYKRHYNVEANQLIPFDEALDIKLQDDTQDVDFNSDTHVISCFEHELAAYKPRCDLIVLLAPTLGLTYRLKKVSSSGSSAIYMQRTAPNNIDSNKDADEANHLFGWEPKHDSVRGTQAGIPNEAPTPPAPDIPDMQNFNNLHFNAYRRDFAQTAHANMMLYQNEQIILTQLSDAADEDTESEILRFTLPDPSPSALLYTYKGYGKDEEAYWQVEPILSFKLDTLVVYKDKAPSTDNRYKVYLIWRAVWPYQNFLEDRYRQLIVNHQAIQGGV